jgi:hypothetical protein
MRTAEQRETIRAAEAIKRAERKAKKAARPKSPKADRGRERDNGFLAFLRRQPCRVAGMTCSGPIQAAHVRYGDASRGKVNPGLQCKPSDFWCVSLCARHHREQHERGNERAWWASFGKDGNAEAEIQYAEYKAGLG